MSFEPSFTVSHAITADLTRVERARGFLEAATLSEDWIREMGARALVLEAHHTTHIEGTKLELAESAALLAGEEAPGADPEDVRELVNYRDAFEFVSSWLGSGGPITEGLVREIHRHLVEGVRGGSAAPGEYRRIQNYVVNAATREVVYTPPPAHDVPILVRELVEWLNRERDVHPVLVSGIAQLRSSTSIPSWTATAACRACFRSCACTNPVTTSSASSPSANTTTGIGPHSTERFRACASGTWISPGGSSSSRWGWPPSSTRSRLVESGRSGGTPWRGITA